MAGLFFYFESPEDDIFSGRDRDLDAWNYASKLSEIDRFAIVNRTDRRISSPDGGLRTEFVEGPEALEGYKVFLCPRATETIWSIDHDIVDWYCFGPASGWATTNTPSFSIPRSDLHAPHAASVVMAARYADLNLLI